MSKLISITFILIVSLLFSNSLYSQESDDDVLSPKELDAINDNGHPDKAKIEGKWLVSETIPVYILKDDGNKKKIKEAINKSTDLLKQQFKNLVFDFKADNSCTSFFEGAERENLGFYKLDGDKIYLHEIGGGTNLFRFEFQKSNLILKMKIPNDYTDFYLHLKMKKVK